MSAPPAGDGAGGREGPVRIAYCDGPRLRRVFLAAYEHLSAHRSELDRINVFPVADGDTGTNLTLTLRSVADAVRPLESSSVSRIARTAARASVLGARGNSGMILSHLLLRFARALGERVRVGVEELSEALYRAGTGLHEALESPVQGTILTVARDAAEEGRRGAARREDLYEWLRDVRDAAVDSLRKTRYALPALREAGVVDAGAKGFVRMLDGAVQYIESGSLWRWGGEGTATGATVEPAPGGARGALAGRHAGAGEREEGEEEGRYCVQITLRRARVPDPSKLRGRLAELGSSLIVLRTGELAKVHIHADDPDAVERRLREFGDVAARRVEDTRAASPGVAVVTDSACDLPREWARAHGVEVVPLQVIAGDRTYRDGVDLGADELLAMLRDRGREPPSTSQPPPRAFLDAYRRALEEGAEEILGIFLSGAVSGTFDSASTAARELEAPVRLVDSRSGSLGLGMQVVRALELLQEGLGTEEVARRIERLRARSNILFTVEDLETLQRSGRVTGLRAWLGGMLDVRPLLHLDAEGNVVPFDRVRGRERSREKLLDHLDARISGAERVRLGVAHAGRPDFAARIERELAHRYRPVESWCRPVTAVLGAHMGEGAWGVCYQIEVPGGEPSDRSAVGNGPPVGDGRGARA